MKITINGKEWPVKITGTVGIAIYADNYAQAMGGNVSNSMMEQLTFYAALVLSNEDADDLPTFMQFVAHWKLEELQEFRKWFDAEWEALDPKPKPKKVEKPKKGEKKKGEG
jgi:hypothetical protein